MIYSEFCIQKSILIFLGASYFWVAGPPKSRLVAGPTPYSARRRNFQKSLRTIVVLRIGYNPREKSAAHPNTRGAPTKKQKNGHFCSTWGGF